MQCQVLLPRDSKSLWQKPPGFPCLVWRNASTCQGNCRTEGPCATSHMPLSSRHTTACYWGSKQFTGTSHSGERLYPTKPKVALGLVFMQKQQLRRGSMRNPRAQGLLAPPAGSTLMAQCP